MINIQETVREFADAGVIDDDTSKSRLISRLKDSGEQRTVLIDSLDNLITLSNPKPNLSNN